MAFNGSGIFNLIYNWQNDAAQGLNISSSRMQGQDADMAAGLSLCLTKDGQQVAGANLPMGGFRHTNVANAQNRTDYAAAGQVQDSAMQWLTAVAGTDTITATSAAPAITAYAAGQTFRFLSAGANATNAVTLNINSIGAKSITKLGTNSLSPGDIPNLAIVELTYDGTQFQMCSATPLVPIPGSNRVLNGNFDVWQDGASFTNAASAPAAYTADCWQVYRAGFAAGYTASRVAGPQGSNYALQVSRNNGDTSTAAIVAGTSFESVDVIKWQGKTMTLGHQLLSSGAFIGATVAATIQFGTGTDGNPAAGITGLISSATVNCVLSSSYQTFRQTVTVPPNATQLFITYNITPSGTAGASDYFQLAQVMFNDGAMLLPLDRRDYGSELFRCKRYFRVVDDPTGAHDIAPCLFTYSTTAAYGTYTLDTQMRAAPTVAIGAGGSAASFTILGAGGGAINLTNLVFSKAHPTGFSFEATTGTAFTQGTGTMFAFGSAPTIRVSARL